MEKKQITVVAKTFLLTAFIIVLSACNKDATRLKIEAVSLKGQSVTIEEQRVNGKKTIDELELSSRGKLSYKFNLRQPRFYNLVFDEGEIVYLLLEPMSNVKVLMDESGLKIEGSEESAELNELYSNLFATRKLLDTLRTQYQLSLDESVRDSISQLYDDVVDDHYKYSMKYVLENLTSLTSMAALYQELAPNTFVFGGARDLQFFKLVTDSLTKYYPKNRHVLALQRNFNSMYSNYNVDKLLGSVDVVEQALPNVELPGVDGKMKSLLEVDQRYVFLNVWASNDQVSHKLFPDLNTVFKANKHKNFTIYNVYLGKSLEDWKRIVNFEEINEWVNVVDTLFPNSQLRGAYNIQQVPTNFLIDTEENTIVAKNINPAELNQKLVKLLN